VRLVRGGCLETIGIAVFALLLGAFGASTWLRHVGGGAETRAPGTRSDEVRPPDRRGRIRVEVRNGSGEPKAAESMTSFLRDHGFDVVEYGNAETFDHERTEILVHGADPAVAREVAAVLSGVPIRDAQVVSPYLDVTVIIGADMRRVVGREGSPSARGRGGWLEWLGRWTDRLPRP